MRRHSASPMPTPSKSRARCRRWNTPNRRSARWVSKPTPLSCTQNTSSGAPSGLVCGRQPTRISTRGRGRLYLSALASRLSHTWLSSRGSPCTCGSSGGSCQHRLSLGRCKAGSCSTRLRLECSRSVIDSSRRCSAERPKREKASRPSMSWPMCSAAEPMVARCRCTSGPSSGPRSSRSSSR